MRHRNKKGQYTRRVDWLKVIVLGSIFFTFAIYLNNCLEIKDPNKIDPMPQIIVHAQVATPTVTPTTTPVVFIQASEQPVKITITPTFSPEATIEPKSVVGESPKEYVKRRASEEYGWNNSQWVALDWIIFKESSWNPLSINKSSGACSLFQALPCSKIIGDWKELKNQVDFGLAYIKDRYSNPINAKKFWEIHHWY